MAAQIANLSCYVGEAPLFALPPVPASGSGGAYTMQFTIRSRAGTVLVTKTTGSGVTYTGGGTTLAWSVQLLEADTNGMGEGAPVGSYSLDRTDAGSTTVFATGQFTLLPDPRTGL